MCTGILKAKINIKTFPNASRAATLGMLSYLLLRARACVVNQANIAQIIHQASQVYNIFYTLIDIH